MADGAAPGTAGREHVRITGQFDRPRPACPPLSWPSWGPCFVQQTDLSMCCRMPACAMEAGKPGVFQRLRMRGAGTAAQAARAVILCAALQHDAKSC